MLFNLYIKRGKHSTRCIVYKEVFKPPRSDYRKKYFTLRVESTPLRWLVLLKCCMYCVVVVLVSVESNTYRSLMA